MQGKQIKNGYLGVYQKEKVICDRRMEVEIDVWEVRKLERSEDVVRSIRAYFLAWPGSRVPTPFYD